MRVPGCLGAAYPVERDIQYWRIFTIGVLGRQISKSVQLQIMIINCETKCEISAIIYYTLKKLLHFVDQFDVSNRLLF